MHVVQLRSRVSPATIVEMRGKRLLPEHLPLTTSTGDLTVYRPDGQPLIIIQRGAVSVEMSQRVMPHLEYAAVTYGSFNRGSYAGMPRGAYVRGDGVVSKQTYTVDDEGRRVLVPSATVGYFDRQGGRLPFCRATAFVRA